MALLPARLRAAIRRGDPIVMLAEIHHPDGTVWAWSGTGTLEYDGKEWTGLGVLGRVTPINTSQDVGVKDFRLELRGVPAQAVQFIGANVRNRPAHVWIAALDRKELRVQDHPMLVASGVMDFQTLNIGSSGEATIAIMVVSGLWQLQSALDQAWSTEEQNKRFPDDTGFDMIPGLVDKQTNWRRTN